MEWTFIETPFFSKRREDHFENDEAFRQFQLALMAHPEKGVPIPGGLGLRKIREGDIGRSQGKRGGFRVIYLLVPETREIVLFHVYPKSQQDDLSRDELRVLAQLARGVKTAALARRKDGRRDKR